MDLPEQQVEQGVVVLQVSETKVGRLRVVGADTTRRSTCASRCRP
jgi:hemolysin activation/secretion protein